MTSGKKSRQNPPTANVSAGNTPNAAPHLAKFIAASGLLSRRAAAEAVKAGRAAINGEVVTDPGRRPAPGDSVTFDGKSVVKAPVLYYIMLNKPRGYVCSNCDSHAGHLAVDLVKIPGVRLFSAGRLDKESEGMLLLSNDGGYVEKIAHPRYRVFKRYEARLARRLTEAEIRRALTGVEDEGEILRFEAVKPLGRNTYEFTLNEGKKREIRRLTAALGAPTAELRRVATGNLKLGGLPPGQWRELSANEITASSLPGFQE